jgi:hypothetical protein
MFMTKLGHVGWSVAEMSDYLGISSRTGESGMGRLAKMGLVVNADLKERGEDGRYVTIMTRYRLAFPADYKGPKKITPSKGKADRQTAAVLRGKNAFLAEKERYPPFETAKPLRSKTHEANTLNETFENKRQDAGGLASLSEDDIRKINDNRITEGDIDEVMEARGIDRNHAYNTLKAKLATEMGIEPKSLKRRAFNEAVEQAMVDANQEHEEQRRRREDEENAEPPSPKDFYSEIEAYMRRDPSIDQSKRRLPIALAGDLEELVRHARRTTSLQYDRLCVKWGREHPRAKLRAAIYDRDRHADLIQRCVDIYVERNRADLHRVAAWRKDNPNWTRMQDARIPVAGEENTVLDELP